MQVPHVLTHRFCSAVPVNSGSLGLVSHGPGQRPGLSRYVVTRGNLFQENTHPSYCLIVYLSVNLSCVLYLICWRKKADLFRFNAECYAYILIFHLFILFLSFCRVANPDKQTLRGSRLSCVKTIWSNRPKEPFSLSLAVLPCSIDQLSQVCAKITEPIDMRNPSRSWGGIQSPSLNEEVCVHHSFPHIWEPQIRAQWKTLSWNHLFLISFTIISNPTFIQEYLNKWISCPWLFIPKLVQVDYEVLPVSSSFEFTSNWNSSQERVHPCQTST